MYEVVRFFVASSCAHAQTPRPNATNATNASGNGDGAGGGKGGSIQSKDLERRLEEGCGEVSGGGIRGEEKGGLEESETPIPQTAAAGLTAPQRRAGR